MQKKKWAVSLGASMMVLTPLTAVTTMAHAATTRYVETNHGWVDYHSSPALKSSISGRLTLGQKALLIGKTNSYWYEIKVNGKTGYITTSSKYTHVVGVASSSSTTLGSFVVTNHGWVTYFSRPKLKSTKLGRLQLGEKAMLVRKYNNYWYEVKVNGKTAYITTSSKYTHVVNGGNSGSATSASSSVMTNHGWVTYFSQPKLSSTKLGRLQLGEKATLVRKYNSYWYEVKVNGKTAYITTSSKFVHVVGSSAPSLPGVSTSTSPSTVSTSASWKKRADAVISEAKTQLGVPYEWGKQLPGTGFDCSNFTEWAFHKALGMTFSRASQRQRDSVGTPVALSHIREGDLLFFKTKHNSTGGGHVGIYMGNGQVIQEGGGWGKVTIEPLASTWLGRNLVYARRVIH